MAPTGWFAARSRRHDAPIRVLTAAAVRLNLQDRGEARRQRQFRQGWQQDAWCVDAETEILTTRGWLRYGDLAIGDAALTLDHVAGEAEWQPVEAVNVFEVADRSMLSIEGRLHSSLSTLDHRWPVLERRYAWMSSGAVARRERRRAVRAGDPMPSRMPDTARPAAAEARRMMRSDGLTSAHLLITAAPCADLPSRARYSDAFVELAAWFWTEGYCRPHGYVTITQSERVNAAYVSRIRSALVETFGAPVTTTRGLKRPAWRESLDRSGCAVFALNAAAGRQLIAVAPEKIVRTGFIRSLTLAQLELFIQTSVDADGHRDNGRNMVVTQAVADRLEPLMLAAILTGRTPHLYRKQNRCWALHIRDKATVNPLGAAAKSWQRAASVRRVSYSGTVWCPTLANRTWLARRNGTVYFTGNSFRDSIGELRYAVNFLANCATRMRLYPAAYPVAGDSDTPVVLHDLDETVPAGVIAACARALSDLGNGRLAIGGLLHSLSTNTTVAGESFLLGQQDPETGQETWSVRSIDEIVVSEDNYRLRELPNDSQGTAALAKLDPKLNVVSRIWTPHPRFRVLADSPLRAIMDDCESLLIQRRMLRAEGRSRLAGRGILKVPDELSIKVPQDDDLDPEADPFMAALAKAMMEPISEEGSASAVVPIVLRGSQDALDKVQHIDLSSKFDAMGTQIRSELVGIIATGLDLPKEIISGVADLNHWSAWQVDDNTFRHHVEPHVIALCDSLTGAYLRPYLASEGIPDEWVQRCVLWYDPTELVTHPDRTADAKDAYAAMVISGETYRAAAGFTEADKPTLQELEARRLWDIRALPLNLLMEYARRADPSLVVPPITVSGTVPGIKPGSVDVGATVDAGGLPAPVAPAGLPAPATNGQPGPDNGQPGPPPAERPPAAPPSPGVTASGRRPDERSLRLSRKLAAIDRDLRSRLHTASNAAMLRALEHAGAKLRTKVAKDETLKTRIAQRPNEKVPAILGDSVVAALGLSPTDLLGNEWGGLRQQYFDWTEAAQRQAVATATRLAGVASSDDAVVAAQSAMVAGRDAGWEMLSAAMTALSHDLLYAPDPNGTEAALNADTLVPTGMIRAALGVAGGGDTTTVELVPVGQIGTGATIVDLLTQTGVEQANYEWQHGPALDPFPPHEDLDGVQFASFDDDALANTEGWPDVAYFMPGDHVSCSCDFAPLWMGADDGSANGGE